MDGRSRPEEIAEQARANGDEAVAVSDHDEVSGHIAFSKACAKEGVKPIFGTEARWLRDITASRRDKTGGYDNSHIVLLAENQTGLRNMWALSSLAYEPANFYRWPQLHPPLMKEYAEGIFASDGCGLSRFAECAEAGDVDGARQEWAVLLDIFGDRFYSELHTFRFLTPPDRALTEAKKELYTSHREALIEAGGEKADVLVEMAALKAAIAKRRKLTGDKGEVVREKDDRTDEILAEIMAPSAWLVAAE